MDSQTRDKISELWESAIPDRYREVETKLIRTSVRRLVIDFIDGVMSPNQLGLLMIGNPGVGKTSIMFCILKHFLGLSFVKQRNNENVLPIAIEKALKQFHFLTHPGIIKELRKSLDKDYEPVYPSIFNSPILFIDDLGRGYDNELNLALLDELIDKRYSHNLPVIASTNMNEKQLRDRTGWERIVDRLADPTFVQTIVVGGPSRRRIATCV